MHFHDIRDDVKTGADAAVDLELPAGLNRLAVFPVRNPEFRSAPYEIESFVNVRPDGKTVEIPLVRRKGLLFKTVLPGDPGQNDPRWGGLRVRVAHKEFHPRGGRSIRHGFYRNLWFYPVDKWGDKVTVSVEFSRGKQREMLLEPTAFAALKDVSWPVRIKVFNFHDAESGPGE